MFQIRNELMSAFEIAQRGHWEDAVVEHLTRACPEALIGYDDQQLRAQIRACEVKAAGYGITAADSVTSFTQILFEEGFDFDEQPPDPWITEILHDAARDQHTKIDHLWAFLDGYEKEDIEHATLERETVEPEEDDAELGLCEAELEGESTDSDSWR